MAEKFQPTCPMFAGVISDELSQFGIQGITEYSGRHHQEKKEIYDCYQYFPGYQRESLNTRNTLKNPVELPWSTELLGKPSDGYL